jgi:hypothetical protein
MQRLLALLVVLGLVACATSAANAVVLIGGSTNNGNLDLTYAQVIVDNPDPDPDFFLPKPQIWQNVGSRTIAGPYEDEMSSEPWAGPAPTPVTTDGNANPPHPEGCGGPDCAVFFKPFSGSVANGPATGSLFQDNPATPGLTYILTGWAGAEANALMADAIFAVEFLDGFGAEIPASGAELSLLPTLVTPNGEAFNYKQYTVSAVAPAGVVSVRARASMIDGLSNPLGGGQAFVIDDFTLTAVPEPATFALVGLAVAGLIGIRRRSK